MGNEQGKEGKTPNKTKSDLNAKPDEDDDDSDDLPFEPEPEVALTLQGLGEDTGPPKGGGDGKRQPTSKPKGHTGSPSHKKTTAPTAKPLVGKATVPGTGTAADEGMRRYVKRHNLTYVPYVALVDLRRALANDQPSIVKDVMQRLKLTPASRPYHPLAFSQLEQNHNSILHFIVLHSSTECFALMQRVHEWDNASDTWHEEDLQQALSLVNRRGQTPRHLIVEMLGQAMQALPPSFREEMAANEDTKTLIPGASIAMAELSDATKERSQAELFALVKRAFDTFVHLRAVRTSHDLLLSRHGAVVHHNRPADDETKSPSDADPTTEEASAAPGDVDEVAQVRDMLAAKGYNGAYLYSTRQPVAEEAKVQVSAD